MIFAVSMTFIDQTIVAIAVPTIQDDLTLSATGVQWIINGPRTVFYGMAAVMVVAFVVSLIGMPAGKVEEGPKATRIYD